MVHLNKKFMMLPIYVALIINFIFAGIIAASWIGHIFIYNLRPQFSDDIIVFCLAFITLIASIASILALLGRRNWIYVSLICGIIIWAFFLYTIISVTISEYPKGRLPNVIHWIIIASPLFVNILAGYIFLKIPKKSQISE